MPSLDSELESQSIEHEINPENMSPFNRPFIESPMKSNPKLNKNFKSPMKSQIDDNFIPDVNISPEKQLLETTVYASQNSTENNQRPALVFPTSSKWKQARYQKCERARRSREAIDPNQPLITNFFSLAEKVCNLINVTPGMRNELLTKTLGDHSGHKTDNLSDFLKKLLEIAQNNLKGPQSKNLYDTPTKKIALYIFYVDGRLLYETLHANLGNSLPSISTLNRFLATNRQSLEEGEIYFEGLLGYLTKRNLPKIVWIAENATRVTSKIKYNSKSNKVVGFTLPLKNGVPVTDKYIASSAEKI